MLLPADDFESSELARAVRAVSHHYPLSYPALFQRGFGIRFSV